MPQHSTPRVRKVAIIGAGGLGCPASLSLAFAGVEALSLFDPDVVELSNLHRQPWHHQADLGRPKVDSAREKLQRSFPQLRVHTEQKAVGPTDAAEIFTAHDLVIDATDSIETKFLLSDTAVKTRVPLVYAGVLRFEGLCMRIDATGPCLRCLFERPPENVLTCAQAGVLGSMAGLMGGLQAHLALGEPCVDVAPLHVVDGLGLTQRLVKVRKRADCEACGARA